MGERLRFCDRMMNQATKGKELYASLLDHINVALTILFIGLLIGTFLQLRYYIREGMGRTETACVKAMGFEWKIENRNIKRGRVIFQFQDGSTVKANDSWIFVEPGRGSLEKDRLEQAWLQTRCFQIWFEKGKEADARIESIKPPFMSLGGLGQWSLLAFCALLLMRHYLKAKP